MPKRRKRSKKWLYPVIFCILLVVAGVVGYFVWDGYFRGETDNGKEQETTGTVVKNTKTGVEEAEKSENPKKSAENNEIKKKEVVKYDGDDPNERAEQTGALTGVMTYAGIYGDTLMVRVNIDQYLNGGTCVLRLLQAGNVAYTAEAEIVESAASSTCAGFDVPMSELNGDNYEAEVVVESGEKTGVIRGEVNG